MSTFLLAETNKLKNIQLFLEKSDNLTLLRKCAGESDLCNYFIECEENRNAEIVIIHNELTEIWKSLKTKKTLLTQDINSLDLKVFKKDMIVIQDQIYNLKIKLKMNYQMLRDQEKDIAEATESYNQKVTEWEKPLKFFSTFNYKVTNITSTHSNNKEVKEFMDFVNKSCGHENGWASEDHQLFLKLRNKHKNTEILATNLHKILPDITPDEVKKHEIWYKKYLFLKNKKEEALERWRQARNENANQKIDNTFIDDTNVSKNNFTKPRDKNIQEKIALWKAEKEARRQREHLYQQMQKEKLQRLQNEKRRLHDELKNSVAKWREEKLIKERTEKLHKELVELEEKKIRSAAEANQMIKRFQTQDDIFIVRMKRNRLKENNEVKRSKSSYVANRDPERILKPTKQWLLRTTKDNFINSEISVYIPNVREIPKLRMPDWRKST